MLFARDSHLITNIKYSNLKSLSNSSLLNNRYNNT